MVSRYPACFYRTNDGYSVYFPDLDVATCADSADEAMMMAVDCLAGCLYNLSEDGKEWPEPSDMNDINPAKYEDFTGECFVAEVVTDVCEYAALNFGETVKRTVRIPLWLDEIIFDREIDLSEFLCDALREKFGE